MAGISVSKTYDFYSRAGLSKYAGGGEWVAIIGKKIVAHGKGAKDTIKEKARGQPL